MCSRFALLCWAAVAVRYGHNLSSSDLLQIVFDQLEELRVAAASNNYVARRRFVELTLRLSWQVLASFNLTKKASDQLASLLLEASHAGKTTRASRQAERVLPNTTALLA